MMVTQRKQISLTTVRVSVLSLCASRYADSQIRGSIAGAVNSLPAGGVTAKVRRRMDF